MTVIDVHTHMLDREWLRQLRDHGAPRYGVGPIAEGLEGIYRDGALFMTRRCRATSTTTSGSPTWTRRASISRSSR